MKKVMTILLIFSMCCPVYALSFMGSTTTDLAQGQYSVGIDYAYSEMDLELSGFGFSWTDQFDTNILLANLSYGTTNDVEIFVRLGLANVEADDFNGSNEFAYGFGTKVNLGNYYGLDWGTLFQIGWFEGDDTDTGFLPGFGIVTADREVEAYEIQVALGPVYDGGSYKIYGGPFFHFVDGNYDFKIPAGARGSYDIEENSIFGGYIGGSLEVTSDSDVGIEFQFTGDAHAFGIRYVLRY